MSPWPAGEAPITCPGGALDTRQRFWNWSRKQGRKLHGEEFLIALDSPVGTSRNRMGSGCFRMVLDGFGVPIPKYRFETAPAKLRDQIPGIWTGMMRSEGFLLV